MMSRGEHIGYVGSEGARLVTAATAAGLDTAVPACSEWTVRDLLTHIGGIHRWAADIVGEARQGFDTAAGDAVGTGPGDDELAQWCTEGRLHLVETLRCAPADLACAVFSKSRPPTEFWCRRQAHETAIHRADAEQAAGIAPAFDTEFALDGIDEIVTVFGGRKKGMAESSVRLEPTDGAPIWLDLGADGARIVDSGPVDVTLTGSAAQIYLRLWNRAADVTLTGHPEAMAGWDVVRPRWS
ncbi:MAG TPA: maleylpyruvate isomerase family mycothiol-dependent enzyme [Mycobacteriales bacterium]|nr:maleylpyruvate isomerase family mycothiol-dependent enzyme [Mycobacteriales bacterium]